MFTTTCISAVSEWLINDVNLAYNIASVEYEYMTCRYYVKLIYTVRIKPPLLKAARNNGCGVWMA